MKDLRDNIIVSAVTVSANYDTPAFDISDMKDVSIAAVWVGNAAGNFQLQVSNDGTNWFNKNSTVAAGGANGSTSWEIANNPWKLARIDFAFSSGSSTLTVQRVGKVYE